MPNHAPKPPRLPADVPPSFSEPGDLSALGADGLGEHLLYDSDDADGLDLEDTVFRDCLFRRVALHGAPLVRASFGECRLEDLNVPVLEAANSGWRNTRIVRSRIGSAELHGASLRSVVFDGGKLGYVNLRAAKLGDVLFRDAIIDELDLGGASLERVAFEDCRIDSLVLNGAKLKDTDLRGAQMRKITGVSGLRGATIDGFQLQDLAPILAAEAGLTVL